jgi:hypothetical protein
MTKKNLCKEMTGAPATRRGISRRSRLGLATVAGAGAIVVAGLAAGLGEMQPSAAPARPAAPADTPDFGTMLVRGLQETEGCLGVDVADFQSGKNTIVAWFENKEAAIRWYNHPTHQRLMGSVGARGGTPLEHVTDNETPIMVMASITFGGKPAVEQSPIPFSQISIEVYAPLPGGASINGRLAPKAFKVPHHKSLDD